MSLTKVGRFCRTWLVLPTFDLTGGWGGGRHVPLVLIPPLPDRATVRQTCPSIRLNTNV